MHDASGNMYDSPIDNQTYNLLQILTSKLEAVEAYNIYEEDMEGEAAELVNRIAEDDRRHACEARSRAGTVAARRARDRLRRSGGDGDRVRRYPADQAVFDGPPGGSSGRAVADSRRPRALNRSLSSRHVSVRAAAR